MAVIAPLPLPLAPPSTPKCSEQPPASRAAEDKAAEFLQEQVSSDIQQRSQRVTVSYVRQMRTELQNRQFNGERLNPQQIKNALNALFNASNPLPYGDTPGADPSPVYAEAQREVAPEAGSCREDTSGNPAASGRPDDRFSRTPSMGEQHASLLENGTPHQPAKPPAQPTAVAQPAAQPPPTAATPTPAKPVVVASATPPTGTPLKSAGTPPPPPGQPPASTGQPVVVATGTGVTVAPEAPPQPPVTVFNYGEKRPACGASPETELAGLNLRTQFSMLCSTSTPAPAPMPTPQGAGDGFVRLADLLRRSGGPDRKAGGGRDRGSSGTVTSHDLAIGMRRQFRDNVC